MNGPDCVIYTRILCCALIKYVIAVLAEIDHFLKLKALVNDSHGGSIIPRQITMRTLMLKVGHSASNRILSVKLLLVTSAYGLIPMRCQAMFPFVTSSV